VPPETTAFDMRDKKYWLISQATWKVTGDRHADEKARNKVVDFNRWFRKAIIQAGGQKTVHAVTNQEEDFTPEMDYGLFVRRANKERLLQTQKALDPDGVFRINQTVHE
jgi:hypothetical protein